MACAGMSKSMPLNIPLEQAEPSFFYSYPGEGGLIFIGAAGRRSNPNETLRLALEDAGRRVALFNQVSGEYAMENYVGSGAFDYIYNTHTVLYYNEESALQYVDSLQYDADTDTVLIDNTFFIRTVYTSALSFPVNFRPTYSGENKKPDWIDNPPLAIDGYEVGIGFSARYASVADTYNNSRNNAIFAIIRNVNSTSQGSDLLYQNTGNLFGYKTSNENIVYSFGTLNGFYVLDTWFDPVNKTVWTLAIANKL